MNTESDLIREAREKKFSRWERVLMADGEMSMVERDATPEVHALADALERAEKKRAAERWWCQDCGRLMAERDRLRAENERLEDRVTTLEERLRHMAEISPPGMSRPVSPQAVR